MLSTQCLCPSSQEQQFTAPVPQHFPAQGQGAGSSCHRWILLCCCQGSPWSFGMCLCLLASLKSVHSVCAGWGSRSFPAWDVSPGMESSKELSSGTASATPPPASCSCSTLGLRWKMSNKKTIFLSKFFPVSCTHFYLRGKKS